MSITVRNTKKEEFLNVVSVDESTNAAVVDKSYFETSADQVIVEDTGNKLNAGNVEDALAEIVDKIGNLDTGVTSVNGQTGAVTLTAGDVGAEPAFTKNTAFNKDFGTTAGTVMQGNDTRVTTAVSDISTIKTDISGIKTKNTEQDTAIAGKANLAGGNAFTGNQSVTGSVTTTGNVTVGGNLTVNGTTTTVNSTTLAVTDKLIEVAHGNTAKLTTPAGLVAPKYDGTNSGALVFDGDGIASVGDVVLNANGDIDVSKSQLQPLATRTGLVDGNLVQYDGTNKTLVDTGKKVGDLVTTNTEQEITAAKTFKDEYGTVVINGEITYTPAASSIGGVNINNEDGDRVIGVFANGGVGQLSLGSSTGKEAALLLKGEPGDAGQVLVSRGTAKTPAWSNSVGKADSATYATRAGSADKVANALTIQYDATGTGTPLATPITYDGSAAKNIVLDSQFTVESTTGKVNVGIGKVKTADSATTASTANKLANALTFSGSDADKTASTGTFDGSNGKTINFWADDFVYPAGAKTGAVMLRNTGVTAGVYTAVQVDAKGRATAGQQAFAVIGPNDDIPSNVVIGGFVLRTKA